MKNYDFLILSTDEFERFSRDLLQKVYRTKIESFTTGKDNGIDLRYTKSKKKHIIQCKRYKNYSGLISNLKKEIGKVKLLNPAKYILTTSVGLTPHDKDEIIGLFGGYIKSTEDIFGKDDLNNYLSDFPSIEKKYYKLWIASSTILEKIIHAKVVNQSEIQKETIIKNLELYVQNNSFVEALRILNKHRFVLISGIPGIGKTTLARFLVYYLIGKGVEEFVFLSDSINDAYQTVEAARKQVFLFDDFLGKRNFTRSTLSTNEDRRILDFIRLIHDSKNKYLIFTTREYILRQAKMELENLNELGKDINCIIDLQKYNKISRGRILYNHLFFYGLPEKYVQSLLNEDLFIKLIDHRNFSPRLIEALTKDQVWEKIEPEKYGGKVLDYFNNPEILWEHVYENQISTLSRCILAILTTTGTPLFISDLEIALQEFSKSKGEKYQKYNYFDFKNSLKELEDTFITTQKDHRDSICISFQNPSIHDFLCHYFNKNRDLLKDVIDSAIFFNQLVLSFTSDIKDHTRILLEKEIEKTIVSKILNEYDYLNLSLIQTQSDPRNGFFYFARIENSDLSKISNIIDKISVSEYEKLKYFLKEKILLIDINSLEDDQIDKYLSVIKIINVDYSDELNLHYKMQILFSNLKTDSELNYFSQLKAIDSDLFDEITNDESAKERIMQLCNDSLYNYSDSDLESFKMQLNDLSYTYDIDFTELQEKIEEKIFDYKEKIADYQADIDYEDMKENHIKSDDSVLRDMFASLISGEK